MPNEEKICLFLSLAQVVLAAIHINCLYKSTQFFFHFSLHSKQRTYKNKRQKMETFGLYTVQFCKLHMQRTKLVCSSFFDWPISLSMSQKCLFWAQIQLTISSEKNSKRTILRKSIAFSSFALNLVVEFTLFCGVVFLHEINDESSLPLRIIAMSAIANDRREKKTYSEKKTPIFALCMCTMK